MQPNIDEDCAHSSGSTITIGSFDGVHIGHQEIIRSVVKQAHEDDSESGVVTFFPHPSKVLRNIEGPFYLSTDTEKKEVLTSLGIDYVKTIEFTAQFAKTPAEKFVRDLHTELNFSSLIVGSDFKLGANREGDISLLSRLGSLLNFKVKVVTPTSSDGEIISSSRIRNLLGKGEVHQVNQLLGRWYDLHGEVVHGDGRGKHIGIPTANIDVWREKLLPATGVYAAWIDIDGVMHPSVVNIGHRPTFYQPGAEQTVEVHILQFNRDIYGKQIKLLIVDHVRSEVRFSSAQELMEQIQNDIRQSKEILAYATGSKYLPVRS